MAASPNRVAIETPRGDIRAGPVVDRELDARADGTELLLTVEIDGARLRVPECETTPP